ncbi:MAG: hypothetical protein ACJA0U_002476 [Salibacteraceae bacterium]|jgi:hypothetical protein
MKFLQMIEPTLVVIAYNREKSLKRLLKSLAAANYPSKNITLHISIDASKNSLVKEVADTFEWKYGEKVIDLKTENIGLLKHVLECGELTDKYESIVILEDDLLVAPDFYNYAVQANDFYAQDEKIAGVSLYTYSSEENNFYPFEPIREKGNVHFIQVASSWGQSWTKNQWSKFNLWLSENPDGKKSLLPDYILNWGSNSWKSLFINYLIDSDRYFVFPNTSYSTNFEDAGTHANNTGLFQVQLNYSGVTPHFCAISESNSIYDVYFELTSNRLKKKCPSLKELDFDVDLYGAKPVQSLTKEYVLTSRRGAGAVKSFGSNMKPLLQNVLAEIEGNEIGLYRKEDLLPTEKNRFLALNVGSVKLDQYSIVRRDTIERATIVVPVLDDQLSDLEVTLKSMNSDRFYNVTLLIVCSHASESSVNEIVANAPVEIETLVYHSENANDLLRFGIGNCSTDYCSWTQPGMKIDLARVEDVARIFQGMSQVQILQGLQNEVNENDYNKLNTASGRWTPQRANSNKTEATKLRSELVFWRKSLVSDDGISKLSSANLFIELLKLNPVYLVALKLGDRNGKSALSSISLKELEGSLIASEFRPKGGFTSIIRLIFHYCFRRNVTFFRLFYRETEQLPLVIRYDFKNDSFYLDNY